MCQYFFVISSLLSNIGLYDIKNGIESSGLDFKIFRSDFLCRLLTFSISFLIVDSL